MPTAGPSAAVNGPAHAWPQPAPSFWTSLRYFAVARVVLASMLLLFVLLEKPAPLPGSNFDAPLFIACATGYLVLALFYLAASVVHRAFHAQLILQVFTDLLAVLVMMHAAGGVRSGVGVLMVAAVAGASVLSSARMAAFYAASATLLLLAQTVWVSVSSDSLDAGAFLPAALIGGACFATAALINRLASRLASQEELAQRRGADLLSQLAVTRLVISELPQGIVVFDAAGRVRTANRSAQELLGSAGPWPALERLVAQHRRDGPRAQQECELTLEAYAGEAQERRLRVRFLRPDDAARTDLVLVIEDPRQIEERARQLKLASMGRLSASIAHEIRNPLAAIRHANSLLAEQLGTPQLQRLARIVEDNSVRIDRIVEDVLSIARRERPSLEPLEPGAFLAALLPEFTAAAGIDPRRIRVSIEQHEPMLFDPRHLRLVLVNLITNALRHSSAEPDAVLLEWRRGAGDRLEFRVVDDGPGLAPEMLEHAFEPFFTTEARGTGLGLYLAREFCNANEASLRYEVLARGGRHGCAFVIQPQTPAGR